MTAGLIALLLASQTATIQRDTFGVPHIEAPTQAIAYEAAGRAVAEDRLWQMEQSRRVARGRMAEVFGKSYLASDREVLLNGYTDAELQEQFDSLTAPTREAFEAYAKGVNECIDSETKSGTLPKGYAENGFKPEPWTVLDSSAIAIRLFQLFGRSASGQLRDLALYQYLAGRPESKDKALETFDDLLWQNDPRSPTTVKPEDDRTPHAGDFPAFTRKDTERQLAALPKVSLFELLPGINLAERSSSRIVAMNSATPYRTGSYAMVISPKRSSGGYPILLSGPQMGFTEPSIVHEISISAPGLQVVGMDVPGVPGVAVGYTANVAWGLTTGVADVEDIVYSKAVRDDDYLYGGKTESVQRLVHDVKVKGAADVAVTQTRTRFGPVVIKSLSGYYFSRHAVTWMRELSSIEALMNLYKAKTADEVEASMAPATVNFNFFYATKAGDVGYRYLGLVPRRSAGLDPRLPVEGSPANEWPGMIQSLPRVRNPKEGLIVNWNNKPAAWWANGDTPAWGQIFRSSEIERALVGAHLTAQDAEQAAWKIARTDSTYEAFRPYLQGANTPWLKAFDGRLVDGSIAASVYLDWFGQLRKDLFLDKIGPMLDPGTFAMAIQPSVILDALQGKTKVDYLAGRKPMAVVEQAYREAIDDLTRRYGPSEDAWRFRATGIKIDGEPVIPYGNRGTYIQIVELCGPVTGRSVLPPGEAESGPHSQDQVDLSREWIYKPMSVFGD